MLRHHEGIDHPSPTPALQLKPTEGTPEVSAVRVRDECSQCGAHGRVVCQASSTPRSMDDAVLILLRGTPYCDSPDGRKPRRWGIGIPCHQQIKYRVNLDRKWSGRRDSNPRPSAPKADALPGYATPRCSDCIATGVPQACRPSHSRNQRMRTIGAKKMAPRVPAISIRKAQSRQVCRRCCSR